VARVDVTGPLDRRCPNSERLLLFHTPLIEPDVRI
jgi:hypothetical protein